MTLARFLHTLHLATVVYVAISTVVLSDDRNSNRRPDGILPGKMSVEGAMIQYFPIIESSGKSRVRFYAILCN